MARAVQKKQMPFAYVCDVVFDDSVLVQAIV